MQIQDTANIEKQKVRHARRWMPGRVVFTPQTLEEAYGQEIYKRVSAMNLSIEILTSNRVTGLRRVADRETYRRTKSTLAVVTAPPS